MMGAGRGRGMLPGMAAGRGAPRPGMPGRPPAPISTPAQQQTVEAAKPEEAKQIEPESPKEQNEERVEPAEDKSQKVKVESQVEE